ncbi:MAG: TetR/AcrR family transcriptional regulator [Chloroflexota bacterium]
MPRILKENDYIAKRNEVLDEARRLVFSKGYDEMSIQDILDRMNISKGAFYHYFESKQALLDAMVERMLEEADSAMSPILENTNLSALEKMRQYFNTGSRWKANQKPFLINLMRVWYRDANILLRHKQEAAIVRHFSPKLAQIIRQGVEEGAFSTQYPEQFADTMLGLLRGVEDRIMGLLLADPPLPNTLEQLESVVGAYYESMERILGAPSGSLTTGLLEILKEWVSTPA